MTRRVLRRARRDHHASEAGFSLVETSVVVTIVGVLVGLAIPTFAGASERASDRVAQDRLIGAVVTAKAAATDSRGRFEHSHGSTISPFDAAFLMKEETSLLMTDDPARVDSMTIGVAVPVDSLNGKIHLWIQGSTGSWWGLVADYGGLTTYCHGLSADAVRDASSCTDHAW